MTVPAGYWDGSTSQLATMTRELLRLPDTDPDVARLTRCADAVIEAVCDYIDAPRLEVFPADTAVLSNLTEACVLATVEVYKRKDAPFGIAGQWAADGFVSRVSRDWLDPVKPALQPFRRNWGVA